MRRVEQMAQAWRFSHLAAAVKNSTLAGIRKALDFWIAGDFKSPNWCDGGCGQPCRTVPEASGAGRALPAVGSGAATAGPRRLVSCLFW